MSKTHQLKIREEFFDALVVGHKTAELRREDDKRFEVGDVLELTAVESGRRALATVSHVLRDCPEFGLMPGFAMLSLGPYLMGPECERPRQLSLSGPGESP